MNKTRLEEVLKDFEVFAKVKEVHVGPSITQYELEESSKSIKERVNKARKIQLERFKGTSINCNARMNSALTRKFCVLSEAASKTLELSFEKLGLSARAYDKILKVSRTIADLDGSEKIDVQHISRAIQFRSLDRKFWGR